MLIHRIKVRTKTEQVVGVKCEWSQLRMRLIVRGWGEIEGAENGNWKKRGRGSQMESDEDKEITITRTRTERHETRPHKQMTNM